MQTYIHTFKYNKKKLMLLKLLYTISRELSTEFDSDGHSHCEHKELTTDPVMKASNRWNSGTVTSVPLMAQTTWISIVSKNKDGSTHASTISLQCIQVNNSRI